MILVAVPSHRGLSEETSASLAGLKNAGLVKVTGDACIDRARSTLFDQALKCVCNDSRITHVLCVDDDMVFGEKEVTRLVEESKGGLPVMGRYAKKSGTLAARTPNRGRSWFGGLGFMVIPRFALIRVSEGLPRIGNRRVWCRTGELKEFPDEWCGEDEWFCSHFEVEVGVRGIRMADVVVGHLKTTVLYPKTYG